MPEAVRREYLVMTNGLHLRDDVIVVDSDHGLVLVDLAYPRAQNISITDPQQFYSLFPLGAADGALMEPDSELAELLVSRGFVAEHAHSNVQPTGTLALDLPPTSMSERDLLLRKIEEVNPECVELRLIVGPKDQAPEVDDAIRHVVALAQECKGSRRSISMCVSVSHAVRLDPDVLEAVPNLTVEWRAGDGDPAEASVATYIGAIADLGFRVRPRLRAPLSSDLVRRAVEWNNLCGQGGVFVEFERASPSARRENATATELIELTAELTVQLGLSIATSEPWQRVARFALTDANARQGVGTRRVVEQDQVRSADDDRSVSLGSASYQVDLRPPIGRLSAGQSEYTRGLLDCEQCLLRPACDGYGRGAELRREAAIESDESLEVAVQECAFRKSMIPAILAGVAREQYPHRTSNREPVRVQFTNGRLSYNGDPQTNSEVQSEH